MSDHTHPRMERSCDVVVVGGSAAGLAAALQLGRQRRSVIVVDSGEPRNARASHLHGYLGHEGVAPGQLIAAGREEVRSYGGEILTGRAEKVMRDGAHLRVELLGGHRILARRVLAATGLTDQLPDIAGLARHWGSSVIHCPFCHGFEVRDQRIVHIVTHPMGLHTAELFHQLSTHLTVVVDAAVEVDDAALDVLRGGGVSVERGRADRVVTGDTGLLEAVVLRDGRSLAADAVAVGPRFVARIEAFKSLGLHAVEHPTGLGDVVETDDRGATFVPGLYAAGNVTDPSHQVSSAAAHGSRVGAMISIDLAHEDLLTAAHAPAPASGNEADWDNRYGSEPIWSGNPNGTLVMEVADLPGGSALDVGAGEGGDALWLAGRGWRVTASDISRRALDRIAAEATRRGVSLACHHADVNAAAAFGGEVFDLVSAQYASIPRTPDARGVRAILDAVAPGGTLIVVSHDLEPMRVPVDTLRESQAFDPEAFVRVEDFAVAITSSPVWEVQTYETRPRPAGAASAAHHVNDVVLRARRR